MATVWILGKKVVFWVLGEEFEVWEADVAVGIEVEFVLAVVFVVFEVNLLEEAKAGSIVDAILAIFEPKITVLIDLHSVAVASDTH